MGIIPPGLIPPRWTFTRFTKFTKSTILLAVFGAFALFILFFLPGCLQRLGSGASAFEQSYQQHLTYTAYSPNQVEACNVGNCWCMVCKNGTNLFGPVKSLIGGYCYFDKNCTAQRVADINNKSLSPDLNIRQFMIGQGPTFGDFATANTFCTDRLSMSIQWLAAPNGSVYSLPDASRAMCFLSKDIIPVYILYSNGTDINVSRAGRIGQILGHDGHDLYQGRLTDGPVGPVVIVTEINFNGSNSHAVHEVARQVREIDRECGNDRSRNETYCLIAVGPKMNDFTALDAVMTELGPDADLVDLVAYGIDGRYAHACDGAGVRQQAINFSSYSLYTYGKPTIIPYVLFDPGTNDSDNSCTWSEADVVSAYGSFFPFGIQTLQKRGVVGIAPYSFNTTGAISITNPLNCTDCGVGRTTSRLRAWYGACQSYTNVTRLFNSGPSAATQLVFGNTSGTVCNQNTQFDFMRSFSFSSRDIFQLENPVVHDPMPLLFSCDACVLSNISRSGNNIFTGLNPPTGTPSDTYCSAFPEVEQWASVRNLDPMLVRAFIATESGFDPCTAAKVCSRECILHSCTTDCFPAVFSGDSECYDRAFDIMEDPSGNCTSYLQNAPDASPPGSATVNPRPSWRWCALGLMQSLEPPYTFWPAQYSPSGINGPFFTIYERSGFYGIQSIDDPRLVNNTRFPRIENARACNPYFNPFNPSDSICVGTLGIESAMASARAWVSANRDRLNWPESDYDKTNLFIAYVAAEKYAGFWDSRSRREDHPFCEGTLKNGDCWLFHFERSYTVTDAYCRDASRDDPACVDGHPNSARPWCYGYTDFIQFVNDCEVPFLPRQVDPGKVKMEMFLYLTNGCSTSSCPDGRRFFQAVERPVPPSGTPYVQDTTTSPSGSH